MCHRRTHEKIDKQSEKAPRKHTGRLAWPPQPVTCWGWNTAWHVPLYSRPRPPGVAVKWSHPIEEAARRPCASRRHFQGDTVPSSARMHTRHLVLASDLVDIVCVYPCFYLFGGFISGNITVVNNNLSVHQDTTVWVVGVGGS
ncbi:hypothetical protein NDU88_002337 [Pleurodeles waltl]|uniref:Uncharacterized protein n=1 Tax=Pleurodeles waltl TaxID=8319 RepID=A0AAV7U991_PLEWA|nr:hypothetical protein NDU88_002337 [Pleurodeles waltl]